MRSECIVWKSNTYLMIMDWCASEWKKIESEQRAEKNQVPTSPRYKHNRKSKRMRLRLSCCEFSFCQPGPDHLCHCSAFEKRNWIYFFWCFSLFPWRWTIFFAHQWTDIIRTFLCVLFIKGNQLYLWPIRIAKTQTMASVSGWWHVGKKNTINLLGGGLSE